MFLGECVVNVSAGGVKWWENVNGNVLTVFFSGRYPGFGRPSHVG